MEFVGNWLRQDGRYCVVMNNIGGVYLEMNEHEEARDAFFESIEMTPLNTTYEAPYVGLETMGLSYPEE